MGLEQDYQRGLQRLTAIPPERLAVRSMRPLVQNYAQAESQRTLSELGTSLERRRVENVLANEREDVRLAKRDAPIALTLGIADVGLKGLGAWEQMRFAKLQELEDQKAKDRLEAFYDILTNHYDELSGILGGGLPAPAPTLVSAPAPTYDADIQPFIFPQRPQPADTFSMRPLNPPRSPFPTYKGGI